MIVMKVKIIDKMRPGQCELSSSGLLGLKGPKPNIKLTRGVSQTCEEDSCRFQVIYLVTYRTG